MKKIKDILRQIMLLYKRFLYGIAKLIERPQEKTVVFEAFQGRSVACSPKAIYLEMLNNPKYMDYNLIWSLRDTNRDELAKNKHTHLVKFESFAYYRALARAKYWIFNSNLRPFLKPRRQQVFVQTWHGTPLKKIGCDVERKGNALTKFSEIKKIYLGEAEKITYMISPSAYCTDKFISAFGMKTLKKEDCVLTTGYPRNDFLFRFTKEQCRAIRSKLGIAEDKKVILYAPTFRDNQYSAKEGFRLQNYMDFKLAREMLGDEYVILFRAHYFISERLNPEQYGDFVIDVSFVEDINELYVISDMLITDYSSVFFDYANLKRPIIFYMSDYEEYKNEVRDFYLDVKELPGEIVSTPQELVNTIKKEMKDFSVNHKYMEFCQKYNYLDGANTAEKVLDKILK